MQLFHFSVAWRFVMAARKLTEVQWDALDDLRFSTTDATVFRNATVILMTAVGRSKTSIGHDLGCSTSTVDHVRQRYREQGLAGLRPNKPTGRPSSATPEYRRALREVVQTPPQSLGYGFSVWSVARLAEHLKKETGIRFSDDQLRRILHQEGFSFQRPKHTMKGKRDEVAYERAQRQLKTLKKKPSKTTPIPR
jgi:transposase